jgi:hypothetical protein
MTQSICRSLGVLGLVGALAGGVVTTQTLRAQGAPGKQNRNGKEGHPVLQNSIRQIEGVKDRLQKAPRDFGGHKEAAIDALNHALNELHQAVQFDQK